MHKFGEPGRGERFNAMQVVEALRSGVPSRYSTRLLPDLREELTDKIKKDLEVFAAGRIPEGRIIWGEYGQGKTHVLTAIEHIALDMGLAVSMISLSREVSGQRLDTFYARAAQRIRTPDSSVYGIYNRLASVSLSSLANTPMYEKKRYVHELPVIVLEEFMASDPEEQEMLYSDLMGVRIAMPELKNIYRRNHGQPFPRLEQNFKPRDHMTAYLGLMADLIKFCGYKGWVILIDELELMGRLGRQSRLAAYKNLYWLLNIGGEHEYPIYVVAAAASRLQSELWYAERNNDRDNIPEIAGVKLGEDWKKKMEYFFQWAVSEHNPTVKPVKKEKLLSLLKQVVDLYQAAYGKKLEVDLENILESLGETTVRTYIRGTLEVLDQLYLYGMYEVPQAEGLEETVWQEEDDFFSEEDFVL